MDTPRSLSLHSELPRSCWDGICPRELYPAVQTLAPRLEGELWVAAQRSTASSWLDHRPERVGAWSPALSSRQPAGQRRGGRSRAAVSVTGAPLSQRGRGGVGPESGSRVSKPAALRSRLPAASSSRGSQEERSRLRNRCPAGAATPPRRLGGASKRISSSAEPTSAQRFLGPSSPEF